MGMKIKPYIDLSSAAAGKVLKVANDIIKSPEQRLILGTTALISMPVIEANNPDATEDQKTLAISKTFAKIIAGTASGFTVRKLCNKYIKSLQDNNKSLFSPENLKGILRTSLKDANVANTIGTFVASFIMIFTNYLWDAPVTKNLTNFFYKRATHRKERN